MPRSDLGRRAESDYYRTEADRGGLRLEDLGVSWRSLGWFEDDFQTKEIQGKFVVLISTEYVEMSISNTVTECRGNDEESVLEAKTKQGR